MLVGPQQGSQLEDTAEGARPFWDQTHNRPADTGHPCSSRQWSELNGWTRCLFCLCTYTYVHALLERSLWIDSVQVNVYLIRKYHAHVCTVYSSPPLPPHAQIQVTSITESTPYPTRVGMLIHHLYLSCSLRLSVWSAPLFSGCALYR